MCIRDSRKIAVLGGPVTSYPSVMRREGAQQAMQDAGIHAHHGKIGKVQLVGDQCGQHRGDCEDVYKRQW